MIRLYVFVLCLLSTGPLCAQQLLPTESLPNEDGVWVDPSFGQFPFFGNAEGQFTERATIWFDTQLLGDGAAFARRAAELGDRPRSTLRAAVIHTLQSLNAPSMAAAQSRLTDLEDAGQISNIQPHWIINGFSCDLHDGGLESLQSVPGVAFIYRALPLPAGGPGAESGPRFITTPPDTSVFDPSQYTANWNQDLIEATRVWNELGFYGEGVLNVIHDFGFKLDVEPLIGRIYRNADEVPGNNLDDDANGYVDDYHGYNFDLNTPVINTASGNANGVIHGNVVAGHIVGGPYVGTNVMAGLAPRASWSPIIGVFALEKAIEWALEQDADTYTMSFSLPNLGELRSHWRKVMEHGALAGLYFISGAGNFANPNSSNFAPVPVQMRVPEDIPGAVFSPAGVDRTLNRPSFSSQGPVNWNTEHYKDGTVNKPDLATLNTNLPYMDTAGRQRTGVNGNSFSGPHLAGVLSLMLSANPELLPWDARTILEETTRDVGDAGFDFQTGHGFIQAFAAVEAALARKPVDIGVAPLPDDLEPEVLIHPNYPNPFTNHTTLRYTLPEASFVNVTVHDTLGREQAHLFSGWQSAGPQALAVRAEDWPTGLYFYRLQTPTTHLTRPILLVR